MNFSDLLPHPEIEIYFGHPGKPLISVLSAVFHVWAIFSIVPLAKNVETMARLNLSVPMTVMTVLNTNSSQEKYFFLRKKPPWRHTLSSNGFLEAQNRFLFRDRATNLKSSRSLLNDHPNSLSRYLISRLLQVAAKTLLLVVLLKKPRCSFGWGQLLVG